MAIILVDQNKSSYDFTLLDIIQTTMAELGLPVPSFAIGNTEQNISQALKLLRAAGIELVYAYPWAQLNVEWGFNTVSGVDKYELPDNWAYFIDQTHWDRTNHWPLLGPKIPQEWQWLKGGLISQGPRIRYRIRNGNIQFHPIPGDSPFQLYMEYISKYWVTDNEGLTPKPVFTRDDDKFYLDPFLLIKFLKFKIKDAKGFDTTGVLSQFQRYYSELIGQDASAPILNMSPRVRPILLGPNNLPDGNWQVGI